MKERITNRIAKHIEYILNKEHLSQEDYDILRRELFIIEQDETKEEREAKQNALINSIATLGILGH